MIRFLLCNRCRNAWIAPVAASCCGEQPIDCNPWSSDARVWFRARLGNTWRAAQVSERAAYGDRREFRETLARGAMARGRAIVGMRSEGGPWP